MVQPPDLLPSQSTVDLTGHNIKGECVSQTNTHLIIICENMCAKYMLDHIIVLEYPVRHNRTVRTFGPFVRWKRTLIVDSVRI